MTDSDLIETGAHVDTAISSIARIIAARDGTDPNAADTIVIASIAALSMIVNSLHQSHGRRGVRFAVEAMSSLEADYRMEADMRIPAGPCDKVK